MDCPLSAWTGVSCSTNGLYLAAVNGDGGTFYTTIVSAGAWGTVGASGAVQYAGNGVWQPYNPAPASASELMGGTVPMSVLPAALVPLSTNNAYFLTNVQVGALTGGYLPTSVLKPSLYNLAANNGSLLTRLPATQLTNGPIPWNVMPGGLLTNGQAAVNLAGAFNGSLGLGTGAGGDQWLVQAGLGGMQITDTTAGAGRLLLDNQGNLGLGVSNVASGHLIDTVSGAYLTSSGVWTSVSDRNAKENFTAIEPAAVLAKVVALPITEWNYKVDRNGVKHLGPVAQDFHAAFGLGDSERAIGSVDEDGVALAAIQGLNQKVERMNAVLRQRTDENELLRQRLLELERMVRSLASQATK